MNDPYQIIVIREQARVLRDRSIFLFRIGLLALLAAIIGFVWAWLAPPAHADSGVTNDPDRLEMILTAKAMDVTAVQPNPKVFHQGEPECAVVRMGARCHLAKGVNLTIRGTDKKYVLLEYLAYGDPKDTTCPIGTMVLMTRQEFRAHRAPEASRRLTAEKLLATVTAILEKGRRR